MSASCTSPPARYCRWSLAPDPRSPRPSALWQGGLRPLSPGTVQEFDLRQPLRDHGGEDQAEEDAADEHIVIVVLQDVELFGRVDTSLVDVQAVRHDLEGRGSERPVRKAPVARTAADSARKGDRLLSHFPRREANSRCHAGRLWMDEGTQAGPGALLTRQVDSRPEGAV